jgi:hypothetical protein
LRGSDGWLGVIALCVVNPLALLGGLFLSLFAAGHANRIINSDDNKTPDEVYYTNKALATIREARAHPDYGMTGLALPKDLFQRYLGARRYLNHLLP